MAYFENMTDLQTAFHSWLDARFNSRMPEVYEKASTCFYETNNVKYWKRFDQWINENYAEGDLKLSSDLRAILWGVYT